jgi:V8-like Glu-specific endopeptidase
MKRLARSVFIIVLLASLLTLTTSVFAQDPGPSAGDESLVVRKRISVKQQDAALAFWTRERMAKAKPMVMPIDLGSSEVDVAAANIVEVSGPPGFSPAGAPAADAVQVAQAAYAQDWAMMSESLGLSALADAEALAPEGTSQVYTSYDVNRWAPAVTIYPHVWMGRLSFRTPSGTSYCSGTSISGNVMLTAAHCLYDSTSNVWYNNWVFTPAYWTGAAPYGTFAATTCWVLTSWVNLSGGYAINTWARHDVGVCKMGTNSSGQTLNQAVGFMGRQWNYPYVRHQHTMGYPFRNYQNTTIGAAGKYLRTCAAETFQQALNTRGMGCNWGPGISGGPWIAGYKINTVTGYADGVNSGFFLNTQNLYGARFNSNNIVPLCNSAGC